MGSVLVINLFLGWTFIGWVVAMAIAARSRPTAAVTSARTSAQEHAQAPYWPPPPHKTPEPSTQTAPEASPPVLLAGSAEPAEATGKNTMDANCPNGHPVPKARASVRLAARLSRRCDRVEGDPEPARSTSFASTREAATS